MLLISVLLFMGIIIGITINMIASFIPFAHQIQNIENYYTSYYGAVSAIEQGMLATKHKEAGFISTGSVGYLNSLQKYKDTKWEIRSRTKKFADGSVNYLYSSGNDQKSKIDYNTVATIFFKVDKSKAFETATETGVIERIPGEKPYSTYSIPHTNTENSLSGNLQYILDDFLGGENINNDLWSDILDSEKKNFAYFSGLNIVKQDNILYLRIDEKFRLDNGAKIPLLEYELEFSENGIGDGIGDEKFTIIGKGGYRDYTTEIEVKKPTKKILNPDFKKSLFPTKPNNH